MESLGGNIKIPPLPLPKYGDFRIKMVTSVTLARMAPLPPRPKQGGCKGGKCGAPKPKPKIEELA